MLKKTLLFLVAMASALWADSAKLALLVDTSGSMKGKELQVRDLIEKVTKENKDNIDIYLFNNTVKKIQPNRPFVIRADGGTNLTLALKTVAKNKPSAIILITDGKPFSPKDVLKEAKKLKKEKVVICSSFIGYGDKPSILDEISEISISNNSIKASLDECLNNAKIKVFLQPSYEENLPNKYTF